jgi:signal peptidase I
MVAVLLALTNLVGGPGFVQGLTNRKLATAISVGAWVVAVAATMLTVWALVLWAAVMIGSMVDAFVGTRRSAPPIRWNGFLAGGVVVFMVAFMFVVRVFALEAFKFPSSSMEPTFSVGDHFFANKLARSPDRGDVIVFAQPCQPERDYAKRVIAVAGDTVEVRCDRVYINSSMLDEQLVARQTSYQDYSEGYGDREGEWISREVSRYRESHGGHTYETFHSPERPTRDEHRANIVDENFKDFPSATLRHCASSDTSEAAASSNQQPGKIVEVTRMPSAPCKPFRHYVVPDGHVFVMGDNRDNSNDSRFWGSVPVENVRGRIIGVWLPFSRFGARD